MTIEAKAILIRETGGTEVMSFETVTVPNPGPGEVLLEQKAIGVNFIDIYRRSGLYPLDELPTVIGVEAAGVVIDTGPGVTAFRKGDRVGYCASHVWAYATHRVIHEDMLAKIPAGISDREAAASLVRGLTAEYLVRRCYHLKPGQTVLVHAADGGVGVLLCQWAKHLGATVIGTVGSPEKAEIARAHGCDHPILYRDEDFVARVREITDGKGVPVVYDSVGKDTFMKSLDCLAPFGMMVSYGNASGPPDPIAPRELMVRGSLYLTRPMLDHYARDPNDLRTAAAALFDVMAKGAVRPMMDFEYALADAARAHADLEARKTTGSVILIP